MNHAATFFAAVRGYSSSQSRRGASFMLAVCACLMLAACGGGGGGSSTSTTTPVASVPAAPPPVLNSIPVTVDKGPVGASAFNAPFVSVTVCRPGTLICQTIDHILLDTGSYGLRLLAPLNTTLGLPQVKWSTGEVAAECSPFISGFTWGSTAVADVKLGGEVAASQTIQLVGDNPGGVTTIPSDCTSVGNNIGTLAALGAKGILGVGLLKEDCGSACVNGAVSGTYYACSGSTCTSVAMPLKYQVSNPVASFSEDNNGVIVAMQAIAAGGARSVAGTLTFGIGTKANNALAGETTYTTNSRGDFTTLYKGISMTRSFIDSGSNGLFFDDASITKCADGTGFYCPTPAMSLTATTMSSDGGTSGNVAFTVENLQSLTLGATAAYAGGAHAKYAAGSTSFDWGLPFFFGRRVFVGFVGNTGGGYWAY